MADVLDTQGSKLFAGTGTGSPETFLEIPKLTSIDPIGPARELRQKTTLSDTDTHKHTLGLADMPEIACEGWWDPDDAQQQQLFKDHHNATVRNYRIRIPVPQAGSPAITYKELTFSALVVGPNTGTPLDDNVPLRFSLKPQSLIAGLEA